MTMEATLQPSEPSTAAPLDLLHLITFTRFIPMRYSTVPAIDADALIARNRDIIANAVTIPAGGPRYRVWSDGQWIVNPEIQPLKLR